MASMLGGAGFIVLKDDIYIGLGMIAFAIVAKMVLGVLESKGIVVKSSPRIEG